VVVDVLVARRHGETLVVDPVLAPQARIVHRRLQQPEDLAPDSVRFPAYGCVLGEVALEPALMTSSPLPFQVPLAAA